MLKLITIAEVLKASPMLLSDSLTGFSDKEYYATYLDDLTKALKQNYGCRPILDCIAKGQDLEGVTEDVMGEIGTAFFLYNYKWKGLIESTLFDYNPITNYDMTEEYNETNEHKYDGTVKEDNGTSVNQSATNGARETVTATSPYDADSFKNASKINMPSVTDKLDSSTNENRSRADSNKSDGTTTHHLTRKGNIGVTTSQQMIESERALRDFLVFKEIAHDIANYIGSAVVDC